MKPELAPEILPDHKIERNKWYKVSVALPDTESIVPFCNPYPSKDILTFGNCGMQYGWYFPKSNKWVLRVGCPYERLLITHWMLLERPETI